MSRCPADKGTSKKWPDKDKDSPLVTAPQPTGGTSSDSNRVNAPQASRPAITNTSRSTSPKSNTNHPGSRPSQLEGQALPAGHNFGQILAPPARRSWANVEGGNTPLSSSKSTAEPRPNQQPSQSLPSEIKQPHSQVSNTNTSKQNSPLDQTKRASAKRSDGPKQEEKKGDCEKKITIRVGYPLTKGNLIQS